MIAKAAQEVLENAKSKDGSISVFDFKPLYGLGDYLVEGKTPLSKILEGARVLLIDICLPPQDIDNLLKMCLDPDQ